MTKKQDETAKAWKLNMAAATKRIEVSNEKAKKRKARALAAFDEWRTTRSTDLLVPYVQVGNSDSRPVVDSGPPVRRAYLHTYGFVGSERRAGMAVLNSSRRNERRLKNKYLFQLIWDVQRASDE